MIEVEKIAILSKTGHSELLRKLQNMNATDLGENNSSNIFYLGDNYQLKVTQQHSKKQAKIALKPRRLGADSSFEYEIIFSEDQHDTAEKIVDILMGDSPKIPTSQTRHDFMFKNVEIAIKYSEDWGYHAELEQMVEREDQIDNALEHIDKIATELGITLLSKEEATARISAELAKRGITY